VQVPIDLLQIGASRCLEVFALSDASDLREDAFVDAVIPLALRSVSRRLASPPDADGVDPHAALGDALRRVRWRWSAAVTTIGHQDEGGAGGDPAGRASTDRPPMIAARSNWPTSTPTGDRPAPNTSW